MSRDSGAEGRNPEGKTPDRVKNPKKSWKQKGPKG